MVSYVLLEYSDMYEYLERAVHDWRVKAVRYCMTYHSIYLDITYCVLEEKDTHGS